MFCIVKLPNYHYFVTYTSECKYNPYFTNIQLHNVVLIVTTKVCKTQFLNLDIDKYSLKLLGQFIGLI